jgi:hypothetical protein
LALADSSPRRPVCKALFDLNRRLAAGVCNNAPVPAKLTGAGRRGRRVVVESLPLFS